MELTINNLIKMVIAGVVMVVMILGIYFAMDSYVIPFFKDIGFGKPNQIIDVLGI